MSESLTGTKTFGTSRRLRLSPTMCILLLGFLLAALLAIPGVTVTTKSLDQLFLAFDWIQRLLKGQVPSADFHSSLGPLAYFLPALGYRLTGSFGGALPAALALVVVVMTIVSSHVLVTRLRPYLAILFAAFVLLILSAPIKLGEPVTALSFGLYHDRIGWAVIALLFAMYLRPNHPVGWQTVIDAVSAAIMTMVLVYIRATYGLLALAFLIFMLTDKRQRLWAAAALFLVFVAIITVETTFIGSFAYVNDVWHRIKSDGVAGGGLPDLLDKGLGNLADLLLLSVLASLVLWRNRSFRDLVFVLLCAAGGLWLLSHNLQRWGIITVHAGALVMTELLLRRMDEDPQYRERLVVNPAGVSLFFLAFVLPTILQCGMALALHAGAAVAKAGQSLALPRMDGIQLADLWTTGDFRAASFYLEMVQEGRGLLDRHQEPIKNLSVLGSVNVFSAALDLEPTQRVIADVRWDFADQQPKTATPAELLGSADTVLLRKFEDPADDLRQLYLPYLQQNYLQVGESENWMLFHRQQPVPGQSRQTSP
ncbi:hypothetical protein [Neorhizobium alkalisoli]|uniref:hypothetical protein n=1 Tax=Neorhizobium alkalisoli TaxID=528178 RepID=UPI000CF9F5BC|nr:hypothetical protein [Neorhizobium alkalisoli]